MPTGKLILKKRPAKVLGYDDRKQLITEIGVFPVYEQDKETFGGYDQKNEIMAKFWHPRNIDHHRKFFALLRCAYANQSQYRDPESFRKVLLIAIGCMELAQGFDGKWYAIPKSMKFESMDQVEFTEEVYNPALVIFADMLSTTPAELDRQKNLYM